MAIYPFRVTPSLIGTYFISLISNASFCLSLTRAVIFAALPKAFGAGALVALDLSLGARRVRLVPEVARTLTDRNAYVRLDVQGLKENIIPLNGDFYFISDVRDPLFISTSS